MQEKTKNKLFNILFALFAVLLCAFELIGGDTFGDELTARLVKITVTRLCGGAIFLMLTLKLRYRVFGGHDKRLWRGALLCFPALLVVVNNLPIIGLVSGNATVERTDLLWLFVLECIAIGFYEELAFRGFVFPLIMEKTGTSRKGIFLATIYSGAVFGLMHLINLFEGAGIGSVILQIGYSFLIGAMCSVVLVKTRNIWLCVALHAIYDFCGFLVPELGQGIIWDMVTVIITAILAVATFVYMLYVFFKTDLSAADGIYTK